MVISDTFGSTSTAVTHDANGNLTDDGTYKYTYDVWNRLVKVSTQDADRVIGVYTYDALG